MGLRRSVVRPSGWEARPSAAAWLALGDIMLPRTLKVRSLAQEPRGVAAPAPVLCGQVAWGALNRHPSLEHVALRATSTRKLRLGLLNSPRERVSSSRRSLGLDPKRLPKPTVCAATALPLGEPEAPHPWTLMRARTPVPPPPAPRRDLSVTPGAGALTSPCDPTGVLPPGPVSNKLLSFTFLLVLFTVIVKPGLTPPGSSSQMLI